MITEKSSSDFVYHMEQVLDVYKRPYNENNPVVCSDESPKQLIGEIRDIIPMEPLAGKRLVKVTDRRTKKDWAEWIKEIVDEQYPNVEKITLVQDNLNTHNPAVLYEFYKPIEAKRLIDKIEFVFTPKHGSWLDMAEIELNVLQGQCLNRRIDNIDEVKEEVEAWQTHRNNRIAKIDWQFTTKKVRIKLKRLYPLIHV